MWQRWTEEEKERLRSFYGKIKTEELAAQLGRTVKQVREAAKRFCKLKKRNKYRKFRKQVLELHRAGVGICGIARQLNLPVRTVEFWFRKKKLQGNGHNAESWEMARRTKRQNRIVKNQRLIWKCLISRYPLRDKDPRIQRFGEFEDLVQECIQHAVRKCMYFDPAKGKLSTWLYTVVRWHAHHMLRSTGIIRASYSWKDSSQPEEIARRIKARKVRTITEREHLIRGEDGRNIQQVHDIQKDIRQALTTCLSPEERNIMRSTYFHSLTEPEMAAKFALTVPYIKMIKRRAMHKLREYMERKDAI